MAVIDCILIDWVISLLPRCRFERWSWQIHVVALISQRSHLQCLTTNVSLIPPAKRVEILRLSTPYGNVGIIVACPYSRTMFEGILVFCCPCHISMRVSLWPVPVAELCSRVSLFCHCPRYMTSTFDLRCDLRCDFRPS